VDVLTDLAPVAADFGHRDGGRGRRWVVLARLPRLPARARLERAAPLHNGRMSQAGQPMRRGRGQGQRATAPASLTSVTPERKDTGDREGVPERPLKGHGRCIRDAFTAPWCCVSGEIHLVAILLL
jgi:hypothetical protein